MLRSVLHKARQHARNAWTGITGKHEAPEIIVSGLKPEEKMMKESIEEECRKTLQRIRREIPARGLLLHFKSSDKIKRTYEIHGVLKLEEKDLHAKATEREVYDALKNLLDDLTKQARRERSREALK